MPYIETNQGIHLFYEKIGKGRPIVFLHPPLMGHVAFRYQKALADRAQLIFYDQRGHGQSGYQASPSLGQVFTDHAEDLRALIEQLRLSKPLLVGYSSGGLIALTYALRHSENIGGILLAGGFPCVASHLLRLEYQLGIQLMKNGNQDLLARLVAKANKNSKQEEQVMYDYARKADSHAVLDLYRAGPKADLTAQLWQLNQLPMRILYGSSDFYIKKHKQFFEPLAHTEIITVDRAFHQLPTHHYKVFNHLIMRFLRQLG
ncbi:alpha/beta fold hydrolase [Sporolactobacillus terrae]|uniref:alpha/beta fold hydrolase n=1 Tax=Sporolactobacillus terrae TaxID=269673 RepID=UPI001118A891|nr:alpha/beta hydrolase [Sporolactobacillus terrae]